MELTRRDALAALAAAGVAVGGGVALTGSEESVETLSLATAAAEVLFPSEVEGHEEFVETYVLGRIDDREGYREGLEATYAELDDVARDWHDAGFAELPRERRDELLSELGADVADPDPDGPISARLRYYVVDELLYAFYSSPTGGRLVGIENPIGHPGGTRSYRQPSMEADEDG